MNDSRLDAPYVRPGISTFPMKHQILTIRLSLQSVFRFCRQIYTQPTESSAGTQRPVQHAGVRALSAFGEGPGGGAVGDVCAGEGVSTRRVSRLAEGLCGHEFSPATISAMVSKLDASLKAFAERRLEEAYPYVLLDARYEKVREEGSVCSRAVQIAIGIARRGSASGAGGGSGEPGKRGAVDGIPVASEGTWPAGSRVCGLGQS